MRNGLTLLALLAVVCGDPAAAHAASPSAAAAGLSALADPRTHWRVDRLPSTAPAPATDGPAVPSGPAPPITGRLADRPFVPSDLPAPDGVPVEQVVVTSDALAASFQRFADDETRRGVPTVVRTTSWIDAHWAGPDAPARIRAFLQDARRLWGTRWVVLGGGPEHVPVRYVPWGADEMPTDMYYECLDGNWNEDGDAVWAEPVTAAANDGLVNDVAVGPDGRPWVATYFGVAVREGDGFTSWGTAAGLPSDQVICVDVAPDGTVWAGTAGGVARWDGVSWRAWTPAEGVPGEWVAAVLAGGADDAWIGTESGLAHWDGTTWRTLGTADGLPNAFVTSLARDGGDLWVGTPSGAARWDGNGFTIVRAATDGTLSDWIDAVSVDPLGRVWLGHPDNWFSDGGLSVREGGVWTTDAFPAQGGLSVRDFAFGPDPSEAWIVTAAGLLHRTTSGDEWIGVAGSPPEPAVYAVERREGADLAVATERGLAERTGGEWRTWGTAEGLPSAGVDHDDVDLLADVVAGRIPAEDAHEVDVYIDKLAAYRRGIGADHADRALVMGENLFRPGDGKALAESAAARLPASYAVTRLYEADGNQSRAATLAAMDEGPGWIVSISHGSYDVLGAGPELELLFNRDLDATDPGGRAAFVLVYSCNSGGFDFESSAEHLLFHPTGGAIATMANTRVAVPTVDAVLNERLLELLFASPTGRAAEAFHDVCAEQWTTNPDGLRLASWIRRTVLTRSYLGAPDLPLWRTPPGDLEVTHPATVPLARAPFEVRVVNAGSGDPLAGALVCVSKGHEDWVRGRTDETGVVTFDFRPEAPGGIDIVVTAVGFGQWESSATAGPATGPHLVAEGADVLDVRSVPGGRELDFRVAMRNLGVVPSDPQDVRLSSADEAVRVVAGSGSLPSIAPGDLAWAGPFVIGVHRSLPDGIPFHVLVEGDGGEPFAEPVRLEARAPSLRLRAVGVRGDLIEPIVENVGSVASGPLRAALVPRDGGGSVLQGSTASEALAPGESRVLEGVLRVTGPAGARFEITVSDGRGGIVARVFDREAPPAPGRGWHEPRDGAALLGWEASAAADVAGYRVLRRAGDDWTDVFPGSLLAGALAEVALAPGATAEFAIVAVDDGGLASADSCLVTAHAAPPTLAGWPRRLSSLVGPSPVIAADLDGDGAKEVIFGSMWEANAVNLFRTDGREWTDGDSDPKTTGPFGVTGERVHAAPLACDVDGDGRKEILAVSFDGYAYAWRVEDDAAGPPSPLPGWPVFLTELGARSGPVAADVDGDGSPEIVTAALDGCVRVHEADGSEVAGWPRATGGFGMGSTPAVADLDQDGREDLVFGADSLLYAVSGTGSDLPGWPVSLGAKILSSPVLGDVDGDGDLEIFAMGRDGRVWSFEHADGDGVGGADLRAGWPAALEPYGHTPPSPALADFDRDGVPELVVPGASHLAVLRADGTAYPGWPKDLGGEAVCSPVVADIDGDGSLDILLGTDDRKLRALRIDGSALEGWPRSFHETPWSTPFVDDVDGDGDLDVVLAADDMDVRIVDVTGPDVPGAAPWPGYHGGASTAGRWVPTSLPGALDPVGEALARPVASLTLEAPAPNPFRSSIELRFALPAAGHVRLEIHDVTGRRVAAPVDAVLAPGPHHASWDGRDARGRPVASGVYFVRLLADTGKRTARILRLR